MTCRELILYILENGLEDEPVFKDGCFVGFTTVTDAALRMNVGLATVNTLMLQGKIDHVTTPYVHFIPVTDKLISSKKDVQTIQH